MSVLVRSVLAMLTLVGSGLTASHLTACGEDCEGGVIIDGKCEGKCDPKSCVEGNTCVENRCKLVCDSHLDCTPEEQECIPAETDEGKAVNVCEFTTKSKAMAKACPIGDECDEDFACPDGTPCGASLEEGDATCSEAECRALHCVTTGEGDTEAYCTTFDCKTDDDCAGGMFCSVARIPNKICGTDKGVDEPCIEPSSFTENGQTIQEGPETALRNVCKIANQCAPCDAKQDCSLVANQACVNLGGEKRCAGTCVGDSECASDQMCASNYCVPRFGTCVGAGKFCDPCLSDLDCGGGTMACRTLGSNEVVGTKACFDSSFPDDCTTDSDCPMSPGGRRGECLDEAEGVDSSSAAYHKCYFPFFSGRFTCW